MRITESSRLTQAMKISVALTLILLASVFANFAEANAESLPAPGERFLLEKATLSPGHIQFPNQQAVGGDLIVTETHVEMTIDMKIVCPADRRCIAVMPGPLTEYLPIIYREKTDCGDIVVAQIDDRPVDGNYRNIKLVDYRTRLCKIYVEHPVHVEYTTSAMDRISGKEVHFTSYFEFSSGLAPID